MSGPRTPGGWCGLAACAHGTPIIQPPVLRYPRERGAWAVRGPLPVVRLSSSQPEQLGDVRVSASGGPPRRIRWEILRLP